LGALIDKLNRNPDDVDALIRCGVFFMREARSQKNPTEWTEVAKAELERAVRLDPTNFYARHNYGQALFQNGDLKPLEGDAARFNPQAAAARTGSPNMHQAVEQFTAAIELNPNSARSFMGRGFAYMMLDDAANAQKDLDEALKLDPGLRREIEPERAAIAQKRQRNATCSANGEEYVRAASGSQVQADVFARNPTRAAPALKSMAENYEKAAELGNPRALFELRHMYESGRGVPPDRQKAAELYERAAACSVGEAELHLAIFHQEGVVYPKNYADAKALYERAVDHGSAEAADHLGYYALFGWGGQRDVNTAVYWYTTAWNMKRKRSAVGPSAEDDLSLYKALAIRQNPNIKSQQEFDAETAKCQAKGLEEYHEGIREMLANQTARARQHFAHCIIPGVSGGQGTRTCANGEVPH
jgi:TPR repeat protein